jgi:hypothetical protein
MGIWLRCLSEVLRGALYDVNSKWDSFDFELVSEVF